MLNRRKVDSAALPRQWRVLIYIKEIIMGMSYEVNYDWELKDDSLLKKLGLYELKQKIEQQIDTLLDSDESAAADLFADRNKADTEELKNLWSLYDEFTNAFLHETGIGICYSYRGDDECIIEDLPSSYWQLYYVEQLTPAAQAIEEYIQFVPWISYG